MTSVLHSSKTAEWYTPSNVIGRARTVLEGIALDPASTEDANIGIGATTIFTKEEDGLKQSWDGYRTIFINPPSGRVGRDGVPAMFWRKLMETRANSRHFEHAIFVAFSLELALTTQSDALGGCMRFPFCVPRRRLAFEAGDGRPTMSPTHGNAIIYVPGSVDASEQFAKVFGDLGMVRL